MVGQPDAERALTDAREIGQAATLMYALLWASWVQNCCGNYIAAHALADELVALGDENGSLNWKSYGMIFQGCVLANTGHPSNAIQMISSGLTAFRSTKSMLFVCASLLYLASAYAELDQFHDAWHCLAEAINAVQVTKERIEAESHRITAEIALKSLGPDAAKAETYFDHALTVARQQHAKS